MKQLLVTLALLLLSCTAIRAQEKIDITPPPAAVQTEATSPAAAPVAVQTAATAPVAVPPSAEPTREVIRTIPAEPGRSPELEKGEIAFLNEATNEWEVSESSMQEPAPRSLADLYLEGGYAWMTAITLCLIAMLFAAWKAPRWVKEFGLLAQIIGWASFAVGVYQIATILQTIEMSPCLFFGGLRVALIAPMYGMIVYAVSLMLRIALKPRI